MSTVLMRAGRQDGGFGTKIATVEDEKEGRLAVVRGRRVRRRRMLAGSTQAPGHRISDGWKWDNESRKKRKFNGFFTMSLLSRKCSLPIFLEETRASKRT